MIAAVELVVSAEFLTAVHDGRNVAESQALRALQHKAEKNGGALLLPASIGWHWGSPGQRSPILISQDDWESGRAALVIAQARMFPMSVSSAC